MSSFLLSTAALLAVAFGISLVGCEKAALDSRVDELCAKDGGVRVYETVSLPPSMFDQWGDPFPGWRGRKFEDRFGPDYRYVEETEYIKNGDPFKGEGRLDRSVTKIFRRADNKLLGEAISYGRSGGDLIPFAHPSSRSCPTYSDDSKWVIKSVFVKQK